MGKEGRPTALELTLGVAGVGAAGPMINGIIREGVTVYRLAVLGIALALIVSASVMNWRRTRRERRHRAEKGHQESTTDESPSLRFQVLFYSLVVIGTALGGAGLWVQEADTDKPSWPAVTLLGLSISIIVGAVVLEVRRRHREES